MRQFTHRIMFTSFFSVGLAFFGVSFLFQFGFFPTIITQELVRWIAPFGLGLVIIGATGMFITSKRHQMKKLKIIGDDEEESIEGMEGKRFHDYITSPEEGTTVYTLFLAGVVIMVWGVVMLFQWIRFIF